MLSNKWQALLIAIVVATNHYKYFLQRGRRVCEGISSRKTKRKQKSVDPQIKMTSTNSKAVRRFIKLACETKL